MNLFDSDFGTEIPLGDGRLRFWPNFIDSVEADRRYRELLDTVPWERSEIRIAGRVIPIPRLNAWYGDSGADYSYSGVKLATQPWSPMLMMLKQDVETLTGVEFNSALVNHYRHGNDSVDWHADDEPELGANPVVASLSFGAVRRFELRHRRDRNLRYRLDLPHGSLLLMAGPLQHHWQHRVPKQRDIDTGRINITFRKVISGEGDTGL